MGRHSCIPTGLYATIFLTADASRQQTDMYDRWLLRALVVFVVAAGAVLYGQSSPERMADPALAALGRGFVSDTAPVNGTTLHYVRGGTGPAVILLHGFPEDWYAYHRIMPLLAKQFTVVAVDLRGIGGSAATRGGYDAANMAEDVHHLAEQLHLEHVYLVGHDIGGMVAYAFVRRYPETSRGVMLLDAPVPSLCYARAYAAPGHLRALLEIYRAFPANEKFNAAQRTA